MTSIGFAPAPFPPESPVSEVGPSSILLNAYDCPNILEKETTSSKSAWTMGMNIGMGMGNHNNRGRAPPPAVKVPPPAITTTVVPPSPNPLSSTSDGDKSPRIRFAPLPDPTRPRSLSTGHNVGHKVSEGPNGEREYTLELRNMTMDDEACNDNAVDEESISDEDDHSDHEDYDWELDNRRKSWAAAMSMGSMSSKGMGSAWSGTKKLVGLKSHHESAAKKSKASGSFGSSTTPVNAMFLSPGRRGSAASTGSNSSSGHRRTASSEIRAPPTAKMLNGRVYGARRASEAAALEKVLREANEPEFVEWGAGGGVGSTRKNKPVTSDSTLSRSLGSKSPFDDDDGGGMSWVRKRREERERKAREAALAEASATKAPDVVVEGNPGMSPGHRRESVSSISSSGSQREKPTLPLTPHDPHTELSGAFADFGGFGASTPKRQTTLEVAPDAKAEEHDEEQHLHMIKIPHARFRRRSEVDDEEEEEVTNSDFDEDDDEEVALVSQKCAAAAGVEVLARHF
ncbi:hypothetical protein CcaverHIS002_0704770 [Cutaneotrichosporon cavernicola]|uniref:Uncharacterized protein n=1 Tax=Cutaneotrichosporon cavernicola TaxID=279322 RepID=A0AA48LAL3_9TREE|nr:uncharacterized protein CcaverHIS019_0704840 [Cutaneotrichosporon cavernicola]BEI87131.1 hypothetical protein CcaverHIS002_0704770 [Cutaneotrichosporon cavernicola]BEI94903.1 hypothetical protein CcaverHIS019_0704840 [Cutaneotrichosporon cavernicola]BEJ02677.1 hypothetical protein CcaverHIS631_0704720 [Cutaneotrichosporon cavernicola]BEJ10433.1 hypothetical protein CcaverHIS641_0704680 [Cutaneotrichosporon cavernicola]